MDGAGCSRVWDMQVVSMDIGWTKMSYDFILGVRVTMY